MFQTGIPARVLAAGKAAKYKILRTWLNYLDYPIEQRVHDRIRSMVHEMEEVDRYDRPMDSEFMDRHHRL